MGAQFRKGNRTLSPKVYKRMNARIIKHTKIERHLDKQDKRYFPDNHNKT